MGKAFQEFKKGAEGGFYGGAVTGMLCGAFADTCAESCLESMGIPKGTATVTGAVGGGIIGAATGGLKKLGDYFSRTSLTSLEEEKNAAGQSKDAKKGKDADD